MARPTLMKLALVIALTIAAGTAYGASTISSTSAVGLSSFSPSNKVSIGVAAIANEYSFNAKHLNGDRIIAVYNSDPKLYYSANATLPGNTFGAPTASSDYSTLSATSSGWSSM